MAIKKRAKRSRKGASSRSGLCGMCFKNKAGDGMTACRSCRDAVMADRGARAAQGACCYRGCVQSCAKRQALCEQHQAMMTAKHHAKLKRTVLRRYGARCACCHEDQLELLTIGHVNAIAEGDELELCRVIKEQRYPEGFEVLCRNCSSWKRINGGVCGHRFAPANQTDDPHGTFSTIVIDCPWKYGNFGAKKHGAARGHYRGMDLVELAQIPIKRWARRDSIVFVWTTAPKLPEATELIKLWGLEFVTIVPWIKTSPKTNDLAHGVGFWFYNCSEFLVVTRIGNARTPKQDGDTKVKGLLWGDGVDETPSFWSPRGPHSRKPLSLIEWIEARLPGPYLEIFATGNRPGWTTWGVETGYWLSRHGVSTIEAARELDLVPENEQQEKVDES